jgi:surface antigen
MNGDCGRMNGKAPDSSNRPESLDMLRMHKNVVAALIALFSLFALPSAAQARLQCVAYARQVSDVQISGNARDWWGNAEGRYDRGQQPKPGAVLAFAGTHAMPYGHVAVVNKIIDDRHILINHANWSRPGMVERGVMAVDVSPAGDWSEVRVWYAPTRSLGLRPSAAKGFIYPRTVTASAKAAAKAG